MIIDGTYYFISDKYYHQNTEDYANIQLNYYKEIDKDYEHLSSSAQWCLILDHLIEYLRQDSSHYVQDFIRFKNRRLNLPAIQDYMSLDHIKKYMAHFVFLLLNRDPNYRLSAIESQHLLNHIHSAILVCETGLNAQFCLALQTYQKEQDWIAKTLNDARMLTLINISENFQINHPQSVHFFSYFLHLAEIYHYGLKHEVDVQDFYISEHLKQNMNDYFRRFAPVYFYLYEEQSFQELFLYLINKIEELTAIDLNLSFNYYEMDEIQFRNLYQFFQAHFSEAYAHQFQNEMIVLDEQMSMHQYEYDIRYFLKSSEFFIQFIKTSLRELLLNRAYIHLPEQAPIHIHDYQDFISNFIDHREIDEDFFIQYDKHLDYIYLKLQKNIQIFFDFMIVARNQTFVCEKTMNYLQARLLLAIHQQNAEQRDLQQAIILLNQFKLDSYSSWINPLYYNDDFAELIIMQNPYVIFEKEHLFNNPHMLDIAIFNCSFLRQYIYFKFADMSGKMTYFNVMYTNLLRKISDEHLRPYYTKNVFDALMSFIYLNYLLDTEDMSVDQFLYASQHIRIDTLIEIIRLRDEKNYARPPFCNHLDLPYRLSEYQLEIKNSLIQFNLQRHEYATPKRIIEFFKAQRIKTPHVWRNIDKYDHTFFAFMAFERDKYHTVHYLGRTIKKLGSAVTKYSFKNILLSSVMVFYLFKQDIIHDMYLKLIASNILLLLFFESLSNLSEHSYIHTAHAITKNALHFEICLVIELIHTYVHSWQNQLYELMEFRKIVSEMMSCIYHMYLGLWPAHPVRSTKSLCEEHIIRVQMHENFMSRDKAVLLKLILLQLQEDYPQQDIPLTALDKIYSIQIINENHIYSFNSLLELKERPRHGLLA